MPQLVTSLSVDYQRNNWSITEALREIIANAFDAEEENKAENKGKMTLHYDPKTKVLTVATAGLTVSSQALLMGTSSSRSNDNCIGQFGEGLPMALLALARDGWKITIYNGSDKWTPMIIPSPEYDGAKVLAIETRKMVKPRNDFVVEIQDIEQDEVNIVYKMFLKLDEDLSPRSVYFTSLSGNQVITHPDYAGRIYVKGVLITHKTNLMYGYNFRDITLNRDRKFLDENVLSHKIQKILDAVCTDNAQFLHNYVESLFNLEPSVSFLEGSTDCYEIRYNSKFIQAVKDTWYSPQYAGFILCRGAEEAVWIEQQGRKGFSVTTLLYDIISTDTSLTTYATIANKNRHDIDQFVDMDTLPLGSTLVKIHDLARVSFDALPSQVKVVIFKDKFSTGYLEDDCVYIAENCLKDIHQLLKIYTRTVSKHASLKQRDIYEGEICRYLLVALLPNPVPQP